MRMVSPVFRMLFHNQRFVLLALGLLGIALFEFLINWMVAASKLGPQTGQLLSLLPPAIRKFLGEETLGFFSPLGLMTIGYSHPFVYAFYFIFIISLFAREISSAMEKGTLELTLSRPLSRSSYLLTLNAFFISGLSFLFLCMFGGAALSIHVFSIKVSPANILPVIVNLFCLAFCMGGIVSLICVSAKTMVQASGWAIGVGLGLYLQEFIGRSVGILGTVSPVNPIHYYRPQPALTSGEYPWGSMLILAAAGIVFFTASFFIFKRRDI